MESLSYAFEDRGEVFTESGLPEMLQRSDTGNDLRETTKRMTSKSNTESKEVKRARITNFSSKQALVCQVLGCNKNLNSSKDYHKRHKVCDEHSKTPKVIVNDIEQRFCQQCSRFHMLAEFDDDKRSCRKRLAGHNERRRKPHRECRFEDIAGSRLLDIPGGKNSIGSHSLLSAHTRNVLRISKIGREMHPTRTMNGSTNFTLSKLDDFGVDYEAEMDRNLPNRPLDCLSFCHISAERGETIDLQQLSTHLLRVEQQRSYDQMKHHSCNLCFTFTR